jgi:hypothetical protein
MDQSVMVFAGTAARSSAIPSPSAGMVAYSTATQLQVYNGSAWVDVSAGYGVATGGTTITPWTIGANNYNGLQFTSDGTLTVTKAGLFDVFLFAGGAGGGHRTTTNAPAGGGGAGGGLNATVYLAATTYAITIGAGGAAATGENLGLGGLPTKLDALVALGGGGGDDSSNITIKLGVGSGGGGTNTSRQGLGTTPQGNNGGIGGFTTNIAGGGGGGYGAVGGNNVTVTGGAGGAGYDVSAFIGGSALFKAGGGGGSGTTGGAGGSSVGGAGASGTSGNAGNAAANTASGGGGCHGTGTAGAGGSGIFYIRFKV